MRRVSVEDGWPGLRDSEGLAFDGGEVMSCSHYSCVCAAGIRVSVS